MAIDYDTRQRFPSSEGTADTTTGDRTFFHSGISTIVGVAVVICTQGTTAPVTGVLYDGAAMTLTVSATDTTEPGRVDIYTLVGLAKAGGISYLVTLQGCIAAAKFCTVSSVTSADSSVLDTSNAVNTTVGTAAQVSLTTSANCCSFGGIHHGAAAPSATPVSGCSLHNSMDYGALSANTVQRTAVDSAGTFAVGVTIGSDDFCAAGVAFAEGAAPPPPAPEAPHDGVYRWARMRMGRLG